MGRHNSPRYAEGLADGQADAAREPADRTGPLQGGSWMYAKGYADGSQEPIAGPNGDLVCPGTP